MARCSLSTICVYCGYPFGQGEHEHCLKRIRHLRLIDKGDQREMQRQMAFLGSKRYKGKSHRCTRCGAVCRWRGKVCHAHTRKWTDYYGGVLSRDKKAVHRLEKTT